MGDVINLAGRFGSYRSRGTVTLVLDEEGADYVAQIMRKEYRDRGARTIAEELEKVLERRHVERGEHA